jgi:phage-related tail fiber protein
MITQSKLKSGTLTLGGGEHDLTDVRVATTANVSLTSAPASIDGVTLAASDRVLVKDQTLPAANGIYVFAAAASPMTRAADTLEHGSYVTATAGTVGAGLHFELTTADPITAGTTDQTWAETDALTSAGKDFACQATNVRLSPSVKETGDEVETLCGDVIGADANTSWTLKGSSIQDFDDVEGFVLYCFENDLVEVPFTWQPSATAGSWSGTVEIRAVEVGGDVNKRLSTDWEWKVTGTGVPALTPVSEV